jgi:Recombinase zinc beta ribbon domain
VFTPPGIVPRSRAGATSRRFLLATLGRCWNCGETMYAVTSTYKRVDGTRARNYMCGHVKNGTGLCDAPSVPAELVDSYVLKHLGDFTDAADRWLHELGSDRQGAEAAAERALADAEAARDELAAGITKLEARYAREDDLDAPKAEACCRSSDASAPSSRARSAPSRAPPTSSPPSGAPSPATSSRARTAGSRTG